MPETAWKIEFVRRAEAVAGIAALTLLAVGCVVVLRPFFSALLWAMILTYATWPAYVWLKARLGDRRSLAAFIMTLLLALAFVLPLVLLGTTRADAIAAMADRVRETIEQGPPLPPIWVKDLPLVGEQIDAVWRNFALNTGEFVAFIRPYLAELRDLAIEAGLSLGKGVLQLSLSVFAAFFFYRDGERAVNRVRIIGQRLIGERAHHLLVVTSATIRGVVYGIIGAAIVQGALAAIGFSIAGVPAPLFLGFLTFLLGLIPMGPPLVWVPVTLWLFAADRIGWAVFMAIWGFFVISGIDNLIKPYMISRESRAPLLLVFLGVIGGILAFGFVGIFLGPVLLGVGYALIVEWTASEQAKHLPRAE